jgi:MFS family permease
MSLRNFHIFFISISSLLCLGMIFWGFWQLITYRQTGGLVLSAVGAAGLAILVGYLKWFLKKYSKLMIVGFAAGIGGLAFLNSAESWACAVCYGDPDSLLTRSTMIGVGFLLVVIVGVLFSIVLIARSWMKRAKALQIPL